MITIMTIGMSYLLGFLTGMVVVSTWVVWLARRSMKKTDRRESLMKRMRRIKEIADEQMDIASQVEMPQRNALDGKHKNQLVGRMKVLDEEKITILKSILSDGFDPELTTMDSAGVISQIKLSEYLASLGHHVPTKTEQKEPPKPDKVGKFTVYRGGKDDDGNTIH
jgi:hypothetical protein